MIAIRSHDGNAEDRTDGLTVLQSTEVLLVEAAEACLGPVLFDL